MNQHNFCRHQLSVAWAAFKKVFPALRQRDFGTTRSGVDRDGWVVEGPDGFVWDTTACCAYEAKFDGLHAYENHMKRSAKELENETMKTTQQVPSTGRALALREALTRLEAVCAWQTTTRVEDTLDEIVITQWVIKGKLRMTVEYFNRQTKEMEGWEVLRPSGSNNVGTSIKWLDAD